jgi:hypothetical protein
MSVYSGRLAGLYVTSSTTPVAATGEATTGDTDKLRYTINAAAKRYIDEDSALTVKVGGSAVSASLYDVEYAGGVIVFHTARGGSDVVTVDYSYFTVAAFVGAKEFNIEINNDLAETPAFGAKGWKQKEYSMSGAKVTLSKWWADNTTLNHMAGVRMVVILFNNLTNGTTMTGPRYEGFGYINKNSIKVVSTGATEETVDVEIDGKLYPREQ